MQIGAEQGARQCRLPFRFTVNAYRGCSHACRYCFARPTHEYLDLDAGADFDAQIVVKTNVVDVLRRELHRPSWGRETVALGTNTDPYQRAEGRYALMPGIIAALRDSGNRDVDTDQGTLLRRDLPCWSTRRFRSRWRFPWRSATPICTVIWNRARPPAARLALITAIRDAGLDCHVMVAPVLPYLTDSVAHLDDLLARISAAGQRGVTVFGLHLRGATRPWFMGGWARPARPGRAYRRCTGGRISAEGTGGRCGNGPPR